MKTFFLIPSLFISGTYHELFQAFSNKSQILAGDELSLDNVEGSKTTIIGGSWARFLSFLGPKKKSIMPENTRNVCPRRSFRCTSWAHVAGDEAKRRTRHERVLSPCHSLLLPLFSSRNGDLVKKSPSLKSLPIYREIDRDGRRIESTSGTSSFSYLPCTIFRNIRV